MPDQLTGAKAETLTPINPPAAVAGSSHQSTLKNSEMVPTASGGVTPAPKQLADLPDHVRTATADILDKQYRLYTWSDVKTQALITTNSIMFAAIGFLYKECMRDALAMLFLTISIISLGISLSTSLLQVIPRVSSGKSGAGPNMRSIRGISLHENWETYYEALCGQTSQMLTVDAVRQIYGMASNNIRSTRIIKRGVVLTIVAISMLLAAIFTTAFSAKGLHALGEWQQSSAATTATNAPVVARPQPASPAKPLPQQPAHASPPVSPKKP